MSENGKTFWLVRTRGGDVLGPFDQDALLEKLQGGLFTADDEIAPSGEAWRSATVLQQRNQSEFTSTSSTQSHTITQSVSFTRKSESNAAPKIAPEPAAKPQASSQPLRSVPNAQAKNWQKPFLGWVVIGVSATLLMLVLGKGKAKRSQASKPNLIYTVSGENDFLKDIYRKIDSGKRKEALAELSDLHQKSPPTSVAGYLVPYGALLITQGESKKRGLAALSQLLTLDADPSLKSQAHNWIGLNSLQEGTQESGTTHFLEALEANPKNTAAKFNLGRAYLKQGEPAKALEYFKLAELESPDLWIIHIFKGHARVELSDFESASIDFEKAVRSSDERWLSYIYYSIFLQAIGQAGKAQTVLRKMLTRDPHYEINSPAPFGFFSDTDKYSDYLEAFSKVMRGPGVGRIHTLGRSYIQYLAQGGELRGAVARIKALAKGGNLLAQSIALKVALDQNAEEKRIKRLMSKLPTNLSPAGYYAYIVRGEAHYRLGNYDEALSDFRQGLLLEPKSAVGRLSLAKWYQKNGNNDEAAEELRKLATFHPHYIPAIQAGIQ